MAVDPSSVGAISEEDLLAKLEEQNRLLQQDSKVPNLPPRIDRASSLTSTASNSTTDSQQPRPNAASVLGSLISAVLHPENADRPLSLMKERENSSSEPIDEYQVWGDMLANWEDTQRRRGKQLQRLVRVGIPSKLRGLAWQLLSGAKNLTLPCGYVELLERDSPCEKQIRRDLARTFPDHEFFKEKDSLGQEALFNVMKAYSLHDREVGYCQGSPFIVGLLLMQMPEEDAFGVLVKLMQEYRLRELFKPSMSELGICLHQLDSLVQEHLTELYGHFQAQGFHSTMYASSWFLTLFSSALPLDLVFRIMDYFLLEGMEAVFRISVALLQGVFDDLLNLDMEGMIKLLQNSLKQLYFTDEAQDALFARAFDLRVNSKKLKKVGKDFQLQRERETEETVENRRLRNENQILLHRISVLEDETQTLASRLIEGQVTRANEAEDVFSLRREMVALRRQLQDLTGSRTSTPNLEADTERLRLRVAQLEVDSDDLTELRRREAAMATSLASSQARIAELASQTVELCRLQRAESELMAEVSLLKQDKLLVLEQLTERNRQLEELRNSVAAPPPLSVSVSALSDEVMINGVEEQEEDC